MVNRSLPSRCALPWTLLIALLGLSACSGRPPPAVHAHTTPDQAAMAWGLAYNERSLPKLRALVHPDRREAFDAETGRLSMEIQRLSVWSRAVGDAVRVNDRLDGHEVKLSYHDGSRPTPRIAVIVRDEGQWWFWTF